MALSAEAYDRLELLRLPQVDRDLILQRRPSAIAVTRPTSCLADYYMVCRKTFNLSYQCSPEPVGVPVYSHLGLKFCPKCDEGLQKGSGSNLMPCPSTLCKTYFCWLSLQTMQLGDHYTHNIKGPYGRECHGQSQVLTMQSLVPSKIVMSAVVLKLHVNKFSRRNRRIRSDCFKTSHKHLLNSDSLASIQCPYCDSHISQNCFESLYQEHDAEFVVVAYANYYSRPSASVAYNALSTPALVVCSFIKHVDIRSV
jgi:hypothetical protein